MRASRLVQRARAPIGAKRTNAQPPPPPLLAVGLLLVAAGLLVWLFGAGTSPGDPPVPAAEDSVGLGLGLGDDVVAAGAGAGARVVGAGATGTALVGAGPGTEEICELCDTCEICPGPPDTCDWWLTCELTAAGPSAFTARSGNATTLCSSRFAGESGAAAPGDAPSATAVTAVTAAASGIIGDFRTALDHSRNVIVVRVHEAI